MKKKDVFRLVTSWGQRKNSEFPWGIEPLHCDALPLSQNRSQSNLKTFRIWKSKVWLLWYNHGYLICALMLCHWAGIGVWHCRSEVQFLMGTQNFFFVQRLWQDEKHLSLFLHWAQNLPCLLFFLQAEWYLPFDWFLLMIYWKQMHRWSHNREIFFLYHITQIDSMLPWICSAVDHGRQ